MKRQCIEIVSIFFSAIFLAQAISVAAAEEEAPAARSAADVDWKNFERVKQAGPPDSATLRDKIIFAEDQMMLVRQVGLAFVEQYPTDPRRWKFISGLDPSWPGFIVAWNPGGDQDEPIPAVVDEAAQAAWKVRIQELRAGLQTASDLPEDVRKWLAFTAGLNAKRKAFYTRWQGNYEKAPEFTSLDLNGKKVNLSKFRGKVVVLDFWATWCGPCKAGLPHMEALAKAYRKQGVVVLACAVDDKRENFEKFVKENREQYPSIVWTIEEQIEGQKTVISRLYGSESIPVQFVIDRKGRVVDAIAGSGKGEVIVDAALAKAGIEVSPDILAQAQIDLEKRGGI